jgi:transglutaminase/protease-like cytokinesis protein 3
VRSLKEKDNFLIKKKSVETSIEKFLDKFPQYWQSNIVYQQSLKDLIEYTDDLKGKISKLEIIKMTVQNISYEFYNTSAVKKLLNFNNY